MPDDDLTAALEQIKADLRTAADIGLQGIKQGDRLLTVLPQHGRVLVAALEAVLKPHQPGRVNILGALCERHENYRYFSITRTEADDLRACGDCDVTLYASCAGCGLHMRADACPVREAITREITGKGEGDV